MSTRSTQNFNSLDNLAMRYLSQSLTVPHPTDEPYVLNDLESRVIRRTKTATLVVAAFLGILGVTLLYLPQQIWPVFFSDTPITISGSVYELPLITILYGALLVYIEVNLLLAINRWGVKLIMHVCQFPRNHDAQYDRHLRALANAALEESNKGIIRFGVDPYLHLPRWGVTFFLLLNLAKAALSELAIKTMLTQVAGRYVFRQMTDFVGAPFYAFWNAWASWRVFHEAQIRIMAPTTIREFVNELYDEWGKDDQFRSLILEALHYTGILKRQYNYANFLLTETLTDRFALKTTDTLTGHFAERLAASPATVRLSIERLLVFGVLIDGKLSWTDRKRLKILRRKGVFTQDMQDIEQLSREYNAGRGLWI